MKLIIGLGNPGKKYSKTRHNIGRRLIEYIASQEDRKFKNIKSAKAFVTELPWNCEPVQAAYLETYMNLSGGPIRALIEDYKISDLQKVLIVVDDIALPLGRMRLRTEGSAGGHNGLASIEGALASQDYARLRIGIGIKDQDNPKQSAGSNEPLHDYVLSNFSKEEEKLLPELLERGLEACRQWAVEPLEKAMNRINSTVL